MKINFITLVYNCRALTCVSSTKEENRLRFGIGRAERAIDNALGAATANGHFAHMDQRIIDKYFLSLYFV